MISKDVASIIAKYNTPIPIYYLKESNGVYVATNNLEDYIVHLFNNNRNDNWVKDAFRMGAIDLDLVPHRIIRTCHYGDYSSEELVYEDGFDYDDKINDITVFVSTLKSCFKKITVNYFDFDNKYK